MAKKTEKQETKQRPRGRRDVEMGEVVSDKMTKTISVLVYRVVKHGRYSKYIKRSTIYKAHDEKNEAKIGDRVKISACRPLSKTKRWQLVEIVQKADQQAEANV